MSLVGAVKEKAEMATKTWITDANNNRCSIDYWGSREAAQKALDSLKNCSGCSDCYRCSDCSDCSGCSSDNGLRWEYAKGR